MGDWNLEKADLGFVVGLRIESISEGQGLLAVGHLRKKRAPSSAGGVGPLAVGSGWLVGLATAFRRGDRGGYTLFPCP